MTERIRSPQSATDVRCERAKCENELFPISIFSIWRRSYRQSVTEKHIGIHRHSIRIRWLQYCGFAKLTVSSSSPMDFAPRSAKWSPVWIVGFCFSAAFNKSFLSSCNQHWSCWARWIFSENIRNRFANPLSTVYPIRGCLCKYGSFQP